MPDLIERLCTEAHDFNFFRAVQLLEEYFQKTTGSANPIDAGKIRFLPDESITFPPNDIAAIEEREGTVSFTLSFMGLVGVTSPLPVYFSEYLSSHHETSLALYDFLTIFNHRMYSLFYRAWKKYHFLYNFTAHGTDSFTRKIAMLSGVDPAGDAKKMRLLAYCGILSSATRSAAGLRTLLSDYFGGIPVAVAEFAPRWAPLRNVKPLGASVPLGRAAILGTTYFDRAGKFRVVVGPLSRTAYEQFLPGTQNIADMKAIILGYLSDPLGFDIEVQLQSIELVPVVLGADETRLGETSALGRSHGMTDIQSIVIR
ncbi:MAG: type VI secretion system baseplate subunit TssG [Chitinispirillaceae bacterium]|nr:type VI secretion system baseplate subunit TssG [Chitinispirillaceae bacterium]